VADLVDLGQAGVVAQVTSYLTPSAWMHVQAGKAPSRSALARTSDVNYNDCEVVREFATSKDGTQVAVNIVRRKDTALDGRNPLLLYGYGGFSISETPRFSGTRRVFLDRGGIWVDVNLRGGGEYGEAWHRAGNLTNKQNVFDDFIAAAEHLIQRGYTNPQRLGIMGGSNGGLLMGAAMTQRPDLFRAVVSNVGIYDMMRVELDPNGAFNVTEFGSVKDPAQFKALLAYSPLHRVKDGTSYPAVLMQTGDNDGRVNPAHSRKMVARLQAADPFGRPILLSTSATSGHGMGTALDERIRQDTDVWGFLIQQLISSQPAR
jgi:prolyl oligopeptidase